MQDRGVRHRRIAGDDLGRGRRQVACRRASGSSRIAAARVGRAPGEHRAHVHVGEQVLDRLERRRSGGRTAVAPRRTRWPASRRGRQCRRRSADVSTAPRSRIAATASASATLVPTGQIRDRDRPGSADRAGGAARPGPTRPRPRRRRRRRREHDRRVDGRGVLEQDGPTAPPASSVSAVEAADHAGCRRRRPARTPTASCDHTSGPGTRWAPSTSYTTAVSIQPKPRPPCLRVGPDAEHPEVAERRPPVAGRVALLASPSSAARRANAFVRGRSSRPPPGAEADRP